MTATVRDRDILARTLYGEARGESFAGQIAVAWTIRNHAQRIIGIAVDGDRG
jgi:spore germination cell wall hydrolase CwlJ-like protein